MSAPIPPAIIRRPVPEAPEPFEVVRTTMPDGSVVERSYCSNAWAVWFMNSQRRNRRLTPRQ